METMTNETRKPRMLLLLRNSTKKQAEKVVKDDGRIEYDIPLQRSILRPWGERMGYDVLKMELVEGGVSGYKISAENRDEIVRLKEMADRHEFEALGIYMSDRLGRIADETPLIVSFLNARGIKVLSYTEGEISAKTHNDKLMTYIRFWQAEGESLKTSIRIKDANEKGVEQGKWRGGCPPYGYRTVSKGSLNFKGRPIFDVEIDPFASNIVKRIFNLYKEHYSSKKIAKILNDEEIPTRNGSLWASNTITKILRNKLYIGIYELGKMAKNVRATSPIMEHLRFIDDETFYQVQELLSKNKLYKGEKRPTVRGARLLTGLLYCECGKKYTAHTQIYRKQRQDGSEWEHECSFYRCGSHRLPKNGQCNKKPINAEKLEKLITDDAKKFLLECDIEKLMASQEDKIKDRENDLVEQSRRIGRERTQKEKELTKLKDEVYKVIIGQSNFSEKLLSELIETKEQEVNALNTKSIDIEEKLADLRATLNQQRTLSKDLNNWADRFDMQETNEKKSMLINLINRITMYDEKVEVKYMLKFDNFEKNQYNSTNGEVIITNPDANLMNFCPQFAQKGTLAKILAWQIAMRYCLPVVLCIVVKN